MEFLNYEGLELYNSLVQSKLDKKQEKITSFSIEKKDGKDFIVLKAGETTVGEVDASDFVINGMCEDASLVSEAKGEANEPEVPYIQLSFKTETETKKIAFSVKDLVDVYTAGNGVSMVNNEMSIDTDVVSVVGHTHTVGEVEGLQTALDSKASEDHSHEIDDINGLAAILDGKADKDDLSPILMEKIYALFGQNVKVADTPEALATAIAENKSICLSNDIVLPTTLLVENDDVKINLNGKTLTVGDNWGIKVTGKNAEISNGVIKIDEHSEGDGNDRAIRVEGGSASISNVTFESPLETFIAVQGTKNEGETIEIKDCTVNAENDIYFAFTQNGNYGGTNWIIKDTVINAPNCDVAVYISNNATHELQNVLIENCEIAGKTCVEAKFANLTVKDSKLEAVAEQTYVKNGGGSCTTGYCVAMTSNNETGIGGKLVLDNNMYRALGDKYVYIDTDEQPSDYELDTDSVQVKA